MKKYLLLLSFLLCGGSAFLQTFNSPESVDYDGIRHRWIVGQNGSGQIHILNGQTMALTSLVTGIASGPHGIECVGDTVFCCDGAWIRGYNLTTGASVFNLNLGATFLNGITWDGGNFLYTTDFSAKKIYKVNISAVSFTLLANTTYTPNGIIYDGANNRCVFVNWGSTARVQAVDLTNANITNLYTTATSNIDGITRDLQGNWYITTWGGNALRRFDPTFSAAPTTVMTGLTSPADIDINTAGDSIGIPNSGSNNNVVFYVIPPATMTAQFSASDNTVCAGSTVTFTDQTSGSPTTWNWTFAGGTPSSSSSQNPTITYSTAGTYSVQLIVSDGLGVGDTLVMNNYVTVYSNPAAPVITQLNATTLESSQTTGNQWNNTGGPISGETGQQFSPTQTGTYTVTYTDANGCTATSAPFNFTSTVGLAHEPEAQGRLYPNPAMHNVVLQLNAPVLNGMISLTDANGKLLVQQTMNGVTMLFDRGSLAAGMYYLQVHNAEGELVFRQKLVFTE